MKKNNVLKNSFILLFAGIVFLSCTTNATVSINESSAADFSYKTTASKNVESLIRSFAGAGQSVSVFDKSVIEKSFEMSEIDLVSVSSVGTADIMLSGKIKDINEIVPTGDQLIAFENTSAGGKMDLHINNETLDALLSLMGSENLVYLELLMAPVFTGEKMSEEEYLSFMSSIYGPAILEDLTDSIISFDMEVPKSIKNAQLYPETIGEIKYSENTARVDISLLSFLVNTSEINLNLEW